MGVPGTLETHEEIEAGLEAWAQGSLPLQSAVMFLRATGERLHRTHPMLFVEGFIDEQDHARYTGRVGLEVFEDSDETWAERTGHMSSGERATWELIRSMCRGEIEQNFWSLDPGRRFAFLQSLANKVDQ
jgi:hypothetical protein